MRENTDQKKLRIWTLFTQCKDEIKLEREMIVKIDHQEHWFNQTMKILEENITGFTDIVSGALQMIGVAFQQQRNNSPNRK